MPRTPTRRRCERSGTASCEAVREDVLARVGDGDPRGCVVVCSWVVDQGGESVEGLEPDWRAQEGSSGLIQLLSRVFSQVHVLFLRLPILKFRFR